MQLSCSLQYITAKRFIHQCTFLWGLLSFFCLRIYRMLKVVVLQMHMIKKIQFKLILHTMQLQMKGLLQNLLCYEGISCWEKPTIIHYNYKGVTWIFGAEKYRFNFLWMWCSFQSDPHSLLAELQKWKDAGCECKSPVLLTYIQSAPSTSKCQDT